MAWAAAIALFLPDLGLRERVYRYRVGQDGLRGAQTGGRAIGFGRVVTLAAAPTTATAAVVLLLLPRKRV